MGDRASSVSTVTSRDQERVERECVHLMEEVANPRKLHALRLKRLVDEGLLVASDGAEGYYSSRCCAKSTGGISCQAW